MRAVTLGLATLMIAGGNAWAADYLRGGSYEGPPAEAAGYNWSGTYFGGQWGRSEARAAFGRTGRSTFTDRLLRPTVETNDNMARWPELPNGDTRGSSYGGFVGYNAQWGDVVVGLELNYSHGSLSVNSARNVFTDMGAPVVGIAAYSGQARITDFGSLRLRAGYAWGWLMPYATVGLAMGRMETMRSVSVSYSPAPPPAPPVYAAYTDTDSKTNALTFGYAFGGGIDIGLLPNVFVRGEYEFVQLNAVNGITASLNNYRAAVAVKF